MRVFFSLLCALCVSKSVAMFVHTQGAEVLCSTYMAEDGRMMPCHCWIGTNVKASLENYLAVHPCVDLPITDVDFATYRAEYLFYNDKMKLINGGFFKPQWKANVSVEFQCFDRENPSWLFPVLEGYINLVAVEHNLSFKKFLICHFFGMGGLKGTFDNLKYWRDKCGLSNAELFLDVLSNEFNYLLSIADPNHSMIECNFNLD